MTSYSEKLKDPRWQKKRLEIFQRDEFTCQSCGDKESTLHLHHVYYETGALPWEYPDEALVTLCVACHEDEHEAMKEAIASLRRQMAASGLNTAIHVSYLEDIVRQNFKKGVLHGKD